MNKIYNIPLSCRFVDTLAEHLLSSDRDNPAALTETLILLPNRRACQNLKEAFIRLNGMNPTLLPQMRPLAEIEEDSLLLSSPQTAEILLKLPPAVSPQERLMLFVKIITSKPADFGLEKISFSQAVFLAKDLGNLIDRAETLKLDFSALQKLAPEEYASHWQETLKFLKIITAYWPSILRERGFCDSTWRQQRLIELQSEQWQKNPPTQKIVIAGSSAAFPALKQLVKTVMQLPSGTIFLHGLDKSLDEDSWQIIDESHPQYELKELLQYLNLTRKDIPDFLPAYAPGKEKLVSELMRPAKTTNLWRGLENSNLDISGLSLIECPDIRTEALAIALKMREILEHPEKTAALITTDRGLSRRVAAELERWNIKVDDSAGRPLLQSPPAIFMRLLIRCAQNGLQPIDMLSLLKHPFCKIGYETADIRRLTRQLEIHKFRNKEDCIEQTEFLQKITEIIRPLTEIMNQPTASLPDMLHMHLQTAEALAGADTLWQGEDGTTLAAFFNDLLEPSALLEAVPPCEYADLLEAFLTGQTVRTHYGTHPRLKILGPIEARLQHFDLTLVGEVNEGTWPEAAASDPWMSRPMKKDFGFPLPERALGICAHDFSELLCAPEIVLCRAARVMGTPTAKSRWLLRLETVLKAAKLSPDVTQDINFVTWAEQLDSPKTYTPISAPEPRPPLSARPRRLSISAIELWMRDPYSIFAKYILNLKPLNELETELSPADYGSILHAVLEEFNNTAHHFNPDTAKEEMLKIGRRHFIQQNIPVDKLAFWLPRFEAGIDWIIEHEKKYRSDIRRLHNEIEGSFSFNAPGGTFTLTAKSDRIDETVNGHINIIDYKTGRAPSPKEVVSGYAPQLPLEGLIAKTGGFPHIAAAPVEKLIYWQICKKETVIENETNQVIETNLNNLRQLVSVFDFDSTAYHSRPNPKKLPEYADYEYLARVKEWSVSGDNND